MAYFLGYRWAVHGLSKANYATPGHYRVGIRARERVPLWRRLSGYQLIKEIWECEWLSHGGFLHDMFACKTRRCLRLGNLCFRPLRCLNSCCSYRCSVDLRDCFARRLPFMCPHFRYSHHHCLAGVYVDKFRSSLTACNSNGGFVDCYFRTAHGRCWKICTNGKEKCQQRSADKSKIAKHWHRAPLQ